MRSEVLVDIGPARAYAPGDEAAIQELFQKVFRRDRADAEWRRRFMDAPGGPAVIHVIEDGGRLVGHIATLGFPTFAGGQHRVTVGLTGDLMVDRHYRGRGLMQHLVAGLHRMDHPFDVRLSFPTDQSGRLSERYGKGQVLGRLPRWVRAAGPGAAATHASGLTKLPAALGTAALKVLARSSSGVTVGAVEDFGTEHDRLAEATAGIAGFVRVRDSDYLRWRWLDRPDRPCTVFEARGGRDVRGWVVVGLDAEDPSLGRVLDVLALDAGSLTAVLNASAAHLHQEGADRIVMDLQDARRWVRRACLSAGFVRFGGDLNVYANPLSDRVDGSVKDIHSWYLTRGDTDLD